MKRMLLVLSAAVICTGCSQMSVYEDYDRDADFAAYQTYRWIERDKADGVIPLYDKRIRTRVDQELAVKGFREVDDGEVDLIVSYEAVMQERIQVRTADYYWPGYYPEVDRYQQGTLIIDLVDPSLNQLVWRGIATGVFDENPQKADEQLAKAITKILKRYPPKK
jgi:hypothetical protein